ncbi:MAG TPA: transglycosylase SLT domain-containing protein, partial [Saprospiraceae bacterium]|nr:transglycosylase SLT domain-containing protein [Saprospiraceae bacterium]
MLGLLGLVAWTDPAPSPDDIINSNLDDQEEVIRERIPSVVTIVNPVYNPAVRSYLNTYIYRRPDQTVEMLGWAAVYFPLFEKALIDEGLPTDLKYLSIVESALNPGAVSRSGACGLWQFMKPTARECGLKISSYVDERMDPEKSTRAAVKYLHQLYDVFHNWELVMAAYNAGPGRIRSAIKRSGTENYWELAAYLPAETQSYVPGFIAASYLMNFHGAHDLIPIYPEPVMGDMICVYVYEGMSIAEVAKRSGLTVDMVKRLNPSFVRNYIPASPAGYPLTLPASSAELFNSGRSMEVPDVALDNNASTKTVTVDGITYAITTISKDYMVRSGDNLYTIAQRNNCSVRDIMTWNELHDSRLSIGQHLDLYFTNKEIVPTPMLEAAPPPLVHNVTTVTSVPTLVLGKFPVQQQNASFNFSIKAS